jgi:hypothetical protein
MIGLLVSGAHRIAVGSATPQLPTTAKVDHFAVSGRQCNHVPSSPVMALMVGAMIIQGIKPGPWS